MEQHNVPRIEIGDLTIVLADDEAVERVLRALAYPLTSQEMADALGVSERTARRWREEGILPPIDSASKTLNRVTVLDLLRHMVRARFPAR